MPLGDRTGPRGLGPRTGRGLGGCPPLKNPAVGIGMGRGFGAGGIGRGAGRGFGRGWRWTNWENPL